MSPAAAANVEESGASPTDDVLALLGGTRTKASLLAECLDGADDDRAEGWRDYVDAVCDAALSRARRQASRTGERFGLQRLEEAGVDID